MDKIKKAVFAVVIGIIGLLMVLAGLNLISLYPILSLYAGVMLLILAVLFYFLG